MRKTSKKFSILLSTLALVFCASFFIGCANSSNWDVTTGKARVVYDLQGGKSFAGSDKVETFYPLGIFVMSLEEMYKNNASELPTYKDHYIIDYWYNVDNTSGKPQYSDKVDFTKLQTTPEMDLLIYVEWQQNLWFQSGYYNENDEWIAVRTRTVKEGEKFNPGPTPNRTGYTFAGYYQDQELTQEWDENFTHPGGDPSTILIYIKWIKNS